MTDLRRYAVAVCTARRPVMLRRCLESLAALEPPAGACVEIVVVENDEQPQCAEVAAAVAAAAGVAVHHVHEPRRGIPIARNRALEECLARGYDWIAFIDDDETARPDWLRKLAEAADAFDAEVVSGPVERVYHVPPPRWWKRLETIQAATGQRLEEAPTNNVLFSARLAAADGLGLRFHPALTFGYEDIDFFRRAHEAGARIVWVADAVVEEEIPESRVRPARLLRRLEMQAAAFAFACALRYGFGTAALRFGGKGARRLVSGAVLVPLGAALWAVSRRRGEALLFRGVMRFVKGFGNLRGLTKFKPDYYRKIDGY